MKQILNPGLLDSKIHTPVTIVHAGRSFYGISSLYIFFLKDQNRSMSLILLSLGHFLQCDSVRPGTKDVSVLCFYTQGGKHFFP